MEIDFAIRHLQSKSVSVHTLAHSVHTVSVHTLGLKMPYGEIDLH